MADKQKGEVRSKLSEEDRKDAVKNPLDTPERQIANDAPEADKRPERPVTEASGIFGPERGGRPNEVEAVKEIADAHPKVTVRLLQGYQRREGEAKLTRGSEVEMPIEDARYLVESKIAELVHE